VVALQQARAREQLRCTNTAMESATCAPAARCTHATSASSTNHAESRRAFVTDHAGRNLITINRRCPRGVASSQLLHDTVHLCRKDLPGN
jgi:hypothetical protein